MLARALQRAMVRVEREESQSIVTLALMSLFILAILAVVVETSAVYIQRRNLQNAADAAALAGAQELNGYASSEAPAIAAAQAYADENLPDLLAVSAVVSEGYTQLQVQVQKKAATAFAGWLSFGEPTVSAKATARIVSPLLPGPGVVPLAIDLATYNSCIVSGQCSGVTLKEFSQNNDVPPRNFGFLDMGGQGGGAPEICNYLRGGSTVPITDPDRAEPGNKNGMRECLHDRMTAAADDSDGIRCLTIEDVLDSTGALRYECNPLGGAGRGADPDYPDAQPTAVIIIPVVQDFDEGGCSSPNNCVDIIGSGNELRTFAFFLIDLTTVEAVAGIGPSCRSSNGGRPQPQYPGGPPPGQCWITGQFLRTWLSPVSTRYDLPSGEYDPSLALLKIVQLID